MAEYDDGDCNSDTSLEWKEHEKGVIKPRKATEDSNLDFQEFSPTQSDQTKLASRSSDRPNCAIMHFVIRFVENYMGPLIDFVFGEAVLALVALYAVFWYQIAYAMSEDSFVHSHKRFRITGGYRTGRHGCAPLALHTVLNNVQARTRAVVRPAADPGKKKALHQVAPNGSREFSLAQQTESAFQVKAAALEGRDIETEATNNVQARKQTAADLDERNASPQNAWRENLHYLSPDDCVCADPPQMTGGLCLCCRKRLHAQRFEHTRVPRLKFLRSPVEATVLEEMAREGATGRDIDYFVQTGDASTPLPYVVLGDKVPIGNCATMQFVIRFVEDYMRPLIDFVFGEAVLVLVALYAVFWYQIAYVVSKDSFVHSHKRFRITGGYRMGRHEHCAPLALHTGLNKKATDDVQARTQAAADLGKQNALHQVTEGSCPCGREPSLRPPSLGSREFSLAQQTELALQAKAAALGRRDIEAEATNDVQARTQASAILQTAADLDKRNALPQNAWRGNLHYSSPDDCVCVDPPQITGGSCLCCRKRLHAQRFEHTRVPRLNIRGRAPMTTVTTESREGLRLLLLLGL